MRAPAFLTWVPLAVVFVVATAGPLLVIVFGALGGATPGGFGRGWWELGSLALRSLLAAGVPALGSAFLAVCLSFLAETARAFRGFYRVWLVAMLFTNPVLLVFGFGVLLSDAPPFQAVAIASCFILLPLSGSVVQSAAEQFPRTRILVARSLGARPWRAYMGHLLPHLVPHAVLGAGVGFVFALGFFLIPAYVGLGRLNTLGSAIERAANQIGDWRAACQLGMVALLLETLGVFVLLLAVQGSRLVGRRRHEARVR